MTRSLAAPALALILMLGLTVLVQRLAAQEVTGDAPMPPGTADSLTAEGVAAPAEAGTPEPTLDARELIRAGGWIGLVILLLSVAMLALLVEHAISIRSGTILPGGLVEGVHEQLAAGHTHEARALARQSESFLGDVLDVGLAEVDLGHAAVEKAMEDTALARTSRLYRKIEYLSIIGTIAPMLGLLGTVWGMIGAFLAFEAKANPQVAELAPGITRALVTTLLGLGVAVPALAGYGIFRNRIEGLTDEATQLAGHLFADLKRTETRRRPAKRTGEDRTRTARRSATPEPERSP